VIVIVALTGTSGGEYDGPAGEVPFALDIDPAVRVSTNAPTDSQGR
jgi:hypothetical protein